MSLLTSLMSGSTGRWTILAEDGSSALSFTSFLQMSVSAEGQALSYPTESGGFVDYNKVTSPLSIQVSLAVKDESGAVETIISKLDEYKTGAVKLSVVTPSWLYESMTLESYSYRRQYGRGAGMLVVDLSLTEVREATSQTAQVTVISSPKNATSSSATVTGKTQTKDASGENLRSSLKSLTG